MQTVTTVPGRSRRRSTFIVACLSGALVAALTGCAAGAANVVLPDKPSHVQVAGAQAARPSARDLVIAAYEGYWRATDEALASRAASKARAIMAGHVPASSMPALVKGLQAIWRRNETGYGSPIFHIKSAKITGRRTAAVHDCIDLSHMGLANQQTGQVVGGSGPSHDFLITALVLEHGRWVVTGAIPVVRTCSY